MNIKLRFVDIKLRFVDIKLRFVNIKLRFHPSLCRRPAWGVIGKSETIAVYKGKG